jgi:hypothetical protein
VTLHAPDLPTDGVRCWVCISCRARNRFGDDACHTCGTSFAALLSAAGTGPAVSPLAKSIVAAAREAALVLGLFIVWKLASAASLMDESGAFARGRWIWHLERALRLPSEVGVQGPAIAHPLFAQALNVFYLAAHIGSMLIFLPWMYFRQPERYRRWRNVVVAFTGICLLMQFVSVAPPRLLPRYGFVDTAARYHQSAYSGLGSGLVDQLSSMPSIHVGWAIIIAVAIVATCRSRWRWLAVAHPVLTVYAVVATANHFWLDAVAAAALVALIVAAGRRFSRLGPGRPDDAALPERA